MLATYVAIASYIDIVPVFFVTAIPYLSIAVKIYLQKTTLNT